MRVAILGAGLTGLVAARQLHAAGCRVTVFDKARTCGGRMTTRQGPCGPLDIGAQYFTARTAAFQAEVGQWIDDGCCAQWRFTPAKLKEGKLHASPDDTIRYTGVGGMGAITHALSDGLDLRCSHHAAGLQRHADGWRIGWSRGACDDRYDVVLLTLPLEQVHALVDAALLAGFTLPQRIHVPCHAVGVATAGRVDPDLRGIFGDDEVSWVSRQSSKPGCHAPTGADDTWMVHFSPSFSAQAGRDPESDLTRRAADWLARATGVDLQVRASQSHYWAYANLIPDPPCDGPFVDNASGLAVAGAWCAGGRVEGAFTSARETCARLLAASSG